MLDTEKITRIEVIEDGKRKFVKWGCIPAFMLQDGGRTLKIFIDGEKVREIVELSMGTEGFGRYENNRRQAQKMFF